MKKVPATIPNIAISVKNNKYQPSFIQAKSLSNPIRKSTEITYNEVLTAFFTAIYPPPQAQGQKRQHQAALPANLKKATRLLHSLKIYYKNLPTDLQDPGFFKSDISNSTLL
ncbi:MAG: hypothetical protein MI784_17805, partial [Cytophagales bacterium]|nr:hypothetical protein [Cytophagales bacterium]